MVVKRVHNIVRSVFTRLTAVLLVTGIAITALVIHHIIEFHRVKYKHPMFENIGQYICYLARDLGSPPSLERARKIGDKLSLRILFEGPSGSWSTSPSLPSIAQFSVLPGSEFLISTPEPGVEVWHLDKDGHHLRIQDEGGPEEDFWRVKYEHGQLLMGLSDRYFNNRGTAHMDLELILMLIVVTTGAYLVIRWILKPLKPLAEGVRQVGRGNLDHRIVVKRQDELGEMASAFNDMAGQIQEMLNAREQLLLDVSHELRSPLTRMKVALEFLSDSEVKETIREDLAEMEIMITEILESARLRNKHARLDRRPVNLADLVRDVAGMFENQPPGVRIARVPETAMVYADAELVKTVLKNILSNAIKYSGDGNEPVHVSLAPGESHAEIRIKDNGIGIPKQEMPYIFEPFYRVDKSRCKETGGYGLGLSLCKTIMEALEGTIGIESEPSTGTTVSLVFPAAPSGESK